MNWWTPFRFGWIQLIHGTPAIWDLNFRLSFRKTVLSISRAGKGDCEQKSNNWYEIVSRDRKSLWQWRNAFVAIPARWGIMAGPIDCFLRYEYWIIDSVETIGYWEVNTHKNGGKQFTRSYRLSPYFSNTASASEWICYSKSFYILI
jgi:hypothetical protein